MRIRAMTDAAFARIHVANDITNGGVGAGTVVLPLADYGNTPGQYLSANADTQEGLQDDDYLRGFHLKPAIKMSAVLDKIMAAGGYTVESTWMGTDSWTNLYMLCGTEGSSVRPWYGSGQRQGGGRTPPAAPLPPPPLRG